MAQNVTVAGASYTAVPAVDLPKTGGGTATFTDTSPTTAVESDVATGKIFFKADGSQATGTASGGGGTTVIVPQQTVTVSGEYAQLTYRGIINSGEEYIVTVNGTTVTATAYYDGSSNNVTFSQGIEVFWYAPAAIFGISVADSSLYGTYTVKVEQEGGGSTLVPKNITANGTYNPEDDNADGYSEVTVALPSGTEGTPTATKGSVSNHSISVTPSVTNTAGVITGGTRTGTAVTVSASELVSGSETKTANGTYNVTNLAELVVSVSGGTSKNTQTVQSTSRRSNTALGSITSLTCSTTGSYDVYWTCTRSNTSQTWGSQLYIGGSAYGNENTTWTNNVQNNHLENVSISANQTVAVYGRSRSGYYIYAPQLTIVQK